MAERETLRVKREPGPQPDARPGVFVLERSFGWVERGVSRYLPAGREFVSGVDDAMIALLHRLGASIKEG